MDVIAGILLALLLGYFLGCFNTAKVVSMIKKVDLQSAGSGNLGASNTVMLIGWKWGLFVGVMDFLKGVLAVVILRLLFPYDPAYAALAGTACVMGHIFPFYMNFKGGKGFATLIGVMCGFSFFFAVIMGVIIITVAKVTDYIVLGTMITIVAYPIYMLLTTWSILVVLATLPITAVIFVKHLPNIKRMLNGTEFKASDAAVGKDRVQN